MTASAEEKRREHVGSERKVGEGVTGQEDQEGTNIDILDSITRL